MSSYSVLRGVILKLLRGANHFAVGLIAIFLLATSKEAFGCQCGVSAFCTRIALHDSMFVGKAIGVSAVDGKNSVFRRRAFRFVVVESFKGPQKVGDEIIVQTGMGGGDCGYGFSVGERYLVDASLSDGTLVTGICGSTMPERRATVELRELRAAAAGTKIPDLSGRVATAPSQAYAITGNSKPLPDIPVVATVDRTGERYRAVTDEDGVYSFFSLPPAAYTLSLELPQRLTTDYDGPGTPITISVPDAGGIGASCKREVDVYPTGSIPGRILDAEGHGIPGSVYVYPTPSESVLADHEWASMARVGPDGWFRVGGLREGSYLLMFESATTFPIKQPLKKIYYPGVDKRDLGTTIRVREGEDAQPVTFVFRKDN